MVKRQFGSLEIGFVSFISYHEINHNINSEQQRKECEWKRSGKIHILYGVCVFCEYVCVCNSERER